MSFLLIVVVALIHAPNALRGDADVPLTPLWASVVQTFFRQGIGCTAVPLFFAIAGFLFFHRFEPRFSQFAEKLRRRFHSLVLPYLIWSGFPVLISILLVRLPWTGSPLQRPGGPDAALRDMG